MKVWRRLFNCTFGFVQVLRTSKTVRFYNDNVKKGNSLKKSLRHTYKIIDQFKFIH